MLTFTPTELIPQHLSKLKEKQLFLQRDMSRHVLAVVIAAGPSGHLICHLNGKRAFHLENVSTRMTRPNVIALPRTVDELTLRIDPDSAATDLFAHSPGRLLVTADDGPSIIVRWPDRHDDDEPYVLQIPQWQVFQVDRPVFGFERWSLGFFDQGQSWKALVNHAGPVQSD